MTRGSAKPRRPRVTQIWFTEKCGEFDSPLSSDESESLRLWQFMRTAKAFLLLIVLVSLANQTVLPPPYGAAGAEGEPSREQPWLVPTPESDRPAHAVLFRPPGEGPFRLAVIAHATTQNVLRRAQMPL